MTSACSAGRRSSRVPSRRASASSVRSSSSETSVGGGAAPWGGAGAAGRCSRWPPCGRGRLSRSGRASWRWRTEGRPPGRHPRHRSARRTSGRRSGKAPRPSAPRHPRAASSVPVRVRLGSCSLFCGFFVFERAFTHKTPKCGKRRIAGRKNRSHRPCAAAAPPYFASPFLFCAACSFVLRSVRPSSPPILVPLAAGLSGAAAPVPPLQRGPFLFRAPPSVTAVPVLRGAAPAFAATRPPRGKKKKVSEAAASETFAGCGCRREGRCYPSRPAVCQKRVWLLSSCCRAGRSGCPSRMRACERAASVMRLPESILAISVVRSSAVSRVMEVRPSRL